MKRLLVFLFLVLGLGLIININANAKIIYCVNKILPNITEKEYLELKKSTFSSSHLMMQLFSINDTKTQFSNNMFECGPEKDKRFKIVSSNEYNKLLSNFKKFALKVENKKTQIAKKEPKKKEKKISKNDDWIKNLAVEGTETEKNEDLLCLIKRNKGDTYSYFPVDKSEIYKLQNSKYNWQKILAPTNVKYPLTTQEKKELKFCDFKIYKSKNYDSYFSLNRLWENTGGFKGPNFISNKTLSKFVDKKLYAEIIKGSNTQIAKKEKKVGNKQKTKIVSKEKKDSLWNKIKKFSEKTFSSNSNKKPKKKIFKTKKKTKKKIVEKPKSPFELKVLAALEEEKKNKVKCIINDKPNLLKGEKYNFCIKKSDIVKLGEYKEFDKSMPKNMLATIKSSKKSIYIRKIAGQNVYKLFVQRTESYHARHPGDVIYGMAWFEILYLDKLKKADLSLKRYSKNQYQGLEKILEFKDKKNIYSLIKMNNGRIKMRNALGMTLYDDLELVLKNYWLLGDFLNNDKLKVKKVRIDPELKKRKLLLEKYKSTLSKYKKKLEEKKNNS